MGIKMAGTYNLCANFSESGQGSDSQNVGMQGSDSQKVGRAQILRMWACRAQILRKWAGLRFLECGHAGLRFSESGQGSDSQNVGMQGSDSQKVGRAQILRMWALGLDKLCFFSHLLFYSPILRIYAYYTFKVVLLFSMLVSILFPLSTLQRSL